MSVRCGKRDEALKPTLTTILKATPLSSKKAAGASIFRSLSATLAGSGFVSGLELPLRCPPGGPRPKTPACRSCNSRSLMQRVICDVDSVSGIINPVIKLDQRFDAPRPEPSCLPVATYVKRPKIPTMRLLARFDASVGHGGQMICELFDASFGRDFEYSTDGTKFEDLRGQCLTRLAMTAARNASSSKDAFKKFSQAAQKNERCTDQINLSTSRGSTKCMFMEWLPLDSADQRQKENGKGRPYLVLITPMQARGNEVTYEDQYLGNHVMPGQVARRRTKTSKQPWDLKQLSKCPTSTSISQDTSHLQQVAALRLPSFKEARNTVIAEAGTPPPPLSQPPILVAGFDTVAGIVGDQVEVWFDTAIADAFDQLDRAAGTMPSVLEMSSNNVDARRTKTSKQFSKCPTSTNHANRKGNDSISSKRSSGSSSGQKESYSASQAVAKAAAAALEKAAPEEVEVTAITIVEETTTVTPFSAVPPIPTPTTASTSASAMKGAVMLTVGDRVEARFEGEPYWYDGTVVAVHRDSHHHPCQHRSGGGSDSATNGEEAHGDGGGGCDGGWGKSDDDGSNNGDGGLMFAVQYDDGDYESNVPLQYIRRLQVGPRTASTDCTSCSSNAVADTVHTSDDEDYEDDENSITATVSQSVSNQVNSDNCSIVNGGSSGSSSDQKESYPAPQAVAAAEALEETAASLEEAVSEEEAAAAPPPPEKNITATTVAAASPISTSISQDVLHPLQVAALRSPSFTESRNTAIADAFDQLDRAVGTMPSVLEMSSNNVDARRTETSKQFSKCPTSTNHANRKGNDSISSKRSSGSSSGQKENYSASQAVAKAAAAALEKAAPEEEEEVTAITIVEETTTITPFSAVPPIPTPTTASTSASAMKGAVMLTVGDRVEARFEGGPYWYDGTVVAVHRDSHRHPCQHRSGGGSDSATNGEETHGDGGGGCDGGWGRSDDDGSNNGDGGLMFAVQYDDKNYESNVPLQYIRRLQEGLRTASAPFSSSAVAVAVRISDDEDDEDNEDDEDDEDVITTTMSQSVSNYLKSDNCSIINGGSSGSSSGQKENCPAPQAVAAEEALEETEVAPEEEIAAAAAAAKAAAEVTTAITVTAASPIPTSISQDVLHPQQVAALRSPSFAEARNTTIADAFDQLERAAGTMPSVLKVSPKIVDSYLENVSSLSSAGRKSPLFQAQSLSSFSSSSSLISTNSSSSTNQSLPVEIVTFKVDINPCEGVLGYNRSSSRNIVSRKVEFSLDFPPWVAESVRSAEGGCGRKRRFEGSGGIRDDDDDGDSSGDVGGDIDVSGSAGGRLNRLVRQPPKKKNKKPSNTTFEITFKQPAAEECTGFSGPMSQLIDKQQPQNQLSQQQPRTQPLPQHGAALLGGPAGGGASSVELLKRAVSKQQATTNEAARKADEQLRLAEQQAFNSRPKSKKKEGETCKKKQQPQQELQSLQPQHQQQRGKKKHKQQQQITTSGSNTTKTVYQIHHSKHERVSGGKLGGGKGNKGAAQHAKKRKKRHQEKAVAQTTFEITFNAQKKNESKKPRTHGCTE